MGLDIFGQDCSKISGSQFSPLFVWLQRIHTGGLVEVRVARVAPLNRVFSDYNVLMVNAVETLDVSIPDVSVIIIVFNDQDRIFNAIASVRSQTLRNLEIVVVDDCSTDGTRQVVERAMREDPRISYVRLDRNSGGCGAPRNAGVRAAKGNWITFLDSDDELERHACKNLLLAAERTDAQVVAGYVTRVIVDSNKVGGWYKWLYQQRRVLSSISEELDQVYDTVSVGKLILRDFFIEADLFFDEDLHYEDLIFTMKLYTRFSRMAIIPETVYRWKVYGSDYRRSITNSTQEVRNLRDRLTSNRRIDQIIAEAGIEGLKEAKDRRFLVNDLSLYMYETIEAGPEFAELVHKESKDYLESIADETYSALPAHRRIPIALLRMGDYKGVPDSAYLSRGWGWITSPRIIDQVAYWDSPALNGSPAVKELLDSSELWNDERAFGDLDVASTVVSARTEGSRLFLAGQIGNPRGRIDEGEVKLLVQVVNTSNRKVRSFPAQLKSSSLPNRLEWEATVVSGSQIPFTKATEQQFVIKLALYRGDLELVTEPKVVGELEQGLAIPAQAPLKGLFGNVLVVTPMATHELRLTLGYSSVLRYRFSSLAISGVFDKKSRLLRQRNRVRRLRGRAARKAKRLLARSRKPSPKAQSEVPPQTELLKDQVVAPGAPPKLEASVYAALPQRQLAIFESHVGRSYSDNPRAIFEELNRRETDLEFLWSVNDLDPTIPDSADVVIRGSADYQRALAEAKFWVDNQGFPADVRKPEGTIYLQTWHGIPLKTMGLDEPRFKKLPPAARQRTLEMIDRWDYLVCPSSYFEETLVRAFNSNATLLGPGTPRNDYLVNAQSDGELAANRQSLDIPLGRQTILYAPTFREHERGARRAARLQMNPGEWEEWVAGSGDSQAVMLRSHYLNRINVPKKMSPRVRNVSPISDTTRLLAATDVLVTDYSSIMFDFACTGRPMIFYAYDLDLYTASARGTYFDIKEWAPGPVVETEQEVRELLSSVDEWAGDYAEKYAKFVERFCGHEDGRATERVISKVFDGYVGETL